MAKYVTIQYRDKNIDNISDLLDKVKIVNISVEDFLLCKNPATGISNKEELFSAYTKQQRKELNILSPDDITESTPIFPPATLYVAIDNVEKDLISYESQFTKQVDTNAFISHEMSKIVNSNGYYKDEYTKIYPKCSVWMWCKALESEYNLSGPDNIVGKLVNITPFIQNIEISVSETGGNFQIQVPYIPSRSQIIYDKKYGGKQDEAYYRLFDIGSHEIIKTEVDEFVVDSSMFNFEGARNLDFISHVLQSNDLIFIKLEKLVMEEDDDIKDDFFINYNVIPANVFDMIGLVDSVTKSQQPEDISVNISGRDLMKLILDDGSFWFPHAAVAQDFDGGIFINSGNQNDANSAFETLYRASENGKPANPEARMMENSLIKQFWSPKSRTIPTALSYLIKSLSNIEVVPSVLFDAYGDRRSRITVETDINNTNN